MKKNIPTFTGVLRFILLPGVCFALILGIQSCNSKLNNNIVNQLSYQFPPIPPDSAYKWLDWNVLFETGSTDSERNQIMNNLRDSIILYVVRLNEENKWSVPVEVKFVFCPCDTLLYNLVANTSLGAVGSIITKPPPVIPPGKSAGEAVKYILQNNSFSDSTTITQDSSKYRRKVIPYIIDTSKTLAIMDTGLDSTLFENGFKGLLWTDPNDRTLRNFLWYSNMKGLDYYYDDNPVKHGSAVTATALEALKSYIPSVHSLPRIMVLKVLDSSGTGSTFSVSCALSYARQKKATLVNASLGYYDNNGAVKDSILRHYVEQCNDATPNPVPIIAAAGNLEGKHSGPLCAPVDISRTNKNLLDSTHLFYPGCFSKDFNNVICVTGLQTTGMPCFYQNYSTDYVNIGVVTNPMGSDCCITAVRFGTMLPKGYEGSSFATPVISGKVMANILLHSTGIPFITALDLTGITTNNIVTKKSLTYTFLP